jgi:uncharacterized membrane protein YedE/YeeE
MNQAINTLDRPFAFASDRPSLNLGPAGVAAGRLVAKIDRGVQIQPVWRVPPRSLAAAIFGGILVGYGARIAYGCNIGAYFSGIASGSLHGWLWLVAAFGGRAIGTRLRPFLFGLRVEGRRSHA